MPHPPHPIRWGDALPRGAPDAIWAHLCRRVIHRRPGRHTDPPATLDELVLSWGGGLCDTNAAILAGTWTAAGHEARVRVLDGHSVAEVRVAGRWEMYDLDMGVRYLDRQGRIAGVDDLVADPTLITRPEPPLVDFVPTTYAVIVRYATPTALAYARSARPGVGRPALPGAVDPPEVPPAASVELIGQADPGGSEATLRMRVHLPPGYHRAHLPLLVVGASGDGDVRGAGINRPLADLGLLPPSGPWVVDARSPVTLDVLVNPLVVDAPGTTVDAHQRPWDLTGLDQEVRALAAVTGGHPVAALVPRELARLTEAGLLADGTGEFVHGIATRSVGRGVPTEETFVSLPLLASLDRAVRGGRTGLVEDFLRWQDLAHVPRFGPPG